MGRNVTCQSKGGDGEAELVVVFIGEHGCTTYGSYYFVFGGWRRRREDDGR